MLKRLFLAAALLLAQSAQAITPAQKRVINQGPLSNLESARAYIRSTKPTLFLDPDYVGSDRENLLTYSETFSNAAWDKATYPVTFSAPTLTATAGAARHGAIASFANGIAGVTYRITFDVEKGTHQYISIGEYGDFAWHTAVLDINTGTLGTTLNATSSKVANGTDRYLFTIEFTRTNGGTINPLICFVAASTTTQCASFTAAGTETVKVYSAQLQRASQNATYTATTSVPLYGPSPSISSVGVVAAINTLYGSTAAFTQGTDANKPILSRPDRVENLQLNSETLTTGVWGAIRSTTSANSTTAPDGATTADTLIEDSSNGTHLLSPSGVSLVSGTTYRFSIYAKTKERSQIRMLLSGSTPNTAVLVNTTTCAEVSTTGSPLNKTYTLGADGWCKISFEVAANATGVAYQELYLANAGSISYIGDGTSGIYLWGAQLQRSSMQPTYIATTTAPVYGSLTGRRMLTFDGSNDYMSSTSALSAIYGASAKTFFGLVNTNLLNTYQEVLDGSGGSQFTVRILNSGSSIQAFNADGAVDYAAATITANAPNAVVVTHDGTNLAIAVNRGAFTSAASGASSALTETIRLGAWGSGTSPFNGQLGPIITYNRVLTQPERDMIRQILQKFWRVG